MSSTNVLRIEDLKVAYNTDSGRVVAVRNATIEVGSSEVVGLVGESGSGKSTIARTILGLLPKKVARIESGKVVIDGKDVTAFKGDQWEKIRGNPAAIIFQDPLSYLNPVMRVGRQIAEAIELHDREAAVNERVTELLGLVKLPKTAGKSFPHELSGGMRQRVLTAIALACRPVLLVADEPTTALDVTTQAEIIELLRDIQKNLGLGVLLITHDLGVVASLADRIYVMYAGRTVETGPTKSILQNPTHPYTHGLISAAMTIRGSDDRFSTIPGEVPDLSVMGSGCSFEPRCPFAMPICATRTPVLLPVPGTEQQAACWLHIPEDTTND